MGTPDTLFFSQNNNCSLEKILRENNITDVARELGLNVGKTVIPCIKREKHVNQNGAPTLTFNIIKNTFRCWVCPDVHGNVIDLVMLVKNVDRDKAIQFLSIRSDIQTESERSRFFDGRPRVKLDPDDHESVFRDFLRNIENGCGMDLIAFASTKGGTGKSLVVNNLAVITSLITRYIGKHRKNVPQLVELIDLDFGKPDQRLLLGIEPEHYLEDSFYNRNGGGHNWELLRQKLPAENLALVSSSPVRRSNSLYYLKKNEILYLMHNSNAHIKFADFGGSTDKDTLDFLNSIKSKVFVINPDRASVEAVFNLILSLLYYPMKQHFRGSREALKLVEKFRNCQRNGFTIEKMRTNLRRIDKSRTADKQLKCFYEETIRPFKEEFGVPGDMKGNLSVQRLTEELPLLRESVYRVMFSPNDNGDTSYSRKSAVYRTFTCIEQTLRRFDSYAHRLESLLQTALFGLIINKCDREQADSIARGLCGRVRDVFSMNLSHLGNIPEEKALSNISNYRMPFIIYDADHPVLDYFYSITDTIIGLKSGSSAKIIYEQREYLSDLKKEWEKCSEHAVFLF